MIQIGILGPLEVYVDGDAVALRGPRQRAVLGRLLLDPRRVVSADRIIEDVWDGDPPDTARKTLHKYVFELRKALPTRSLRTVPAGYVLDIDDEAIDSRRFERLVADRRFAAALAWPGGRAAGRPARPGIRCAGTGRLGELRLFAIESRRRRPRSRAPRVGDRRAADLVEAHPLRERLTASLMLALSAPAARSRHCERSSAIDGVGGDRRRARRRVARTRGRDPPSRSASRIRPRHRFARVIVLTGQCAQR